MTVSINGEVGGDWFREYLILIPLKNTITNIQCQCLGQCHTYDI